MRTGWTALAMLAALGATACERERSASGGLPPAAEWKPPAPKPSVVEGGRRGAAQSGAEGGGRDPHAGLAMEGEADPHAGLAMEGEADPHAGLAIDGAGDAGEPAEERPPGETLARGTIRAGGDAAAAVKPGAILYIIAIPVAATGKPSQSAVAIDRLELTSLPMPFELTGSPFKGEVLIRAWTDADGEARTREPGDAEGQVRARLPADKVELVLDTVLR